MKAPCKLYIEKFLIINICTRIYKDNILSISSIIASQGTKLCSVIKKLYTNIK